MTMMMNVLNLRNARESLLVQKEIEENYFSNEMTFPSLLSLLTAE